MESNSDFENRANQANADPKDSTVHQTVKIPVMEEELQVGKKTIETGGVKIFKTVQEEEVLIDTPFYEEKIEVERVPVHQYVDEQTPSVRYEGDTMVIPILKEEYVKRTLLVEEVRVTKHKMRKEAPGSVKLRKEKVNVDRFETPSTNEEKF